MIMGGVQTSVQTFFNLFLKSLTEGAVTTETGSLFQYFTTLIENSDPLLRTLEYLVGVPSKAVPSMREKKQVWVNIQKALEYLECGNQVSPKSSSL